MLDLARCGELLAGAGGALHPALAPTTARTRIPIQADVLFLCTGNSARSQLAEALCEQLSDGTITAASAGSHPKPLSPHAVRVMRDRGIDISGRRTKHLSEFTDHHFDHVISLCDRVREVCPDFPGAERTHWSIPEPRPGEFERTAAELETRIGFLIAAICRR